MRSRARFSGVSAPLQCIMVLSFSVFATPLLAQETVVHLDPAATQIAFTLAATAHTVHGTFKLKTGELRFDPATGKMSGSVVVDATSGNTDNTSRDRKMHTDVLESAKFPEIVFTPTGANGTLPQTGAADVQVSGVLRLHGQDHATTITLSIDRAANGAFHASARFPVPYVQWGLKDPSNFLLHVADTVQLEIHAAGQIAPAGPTP